MHQSGGDDSVLYVLVVEANAPDRFRIVSVLTTEHVALQNARSATVTESVGRSMIYMGSLSASLVALALIAQSESTVSDFRLFALVILPVLLFLGTVTFVRIIETGIEDAVYARAISRIRHFYLEIAAEDGRYFLLGGHDDMDGTLSNMGMTASPWRPFVSAASVIAVINSIVCGALIGIGLDAFAPRSIAVITAVVVAAIAVAGHYRIGFRRFNHALERFAPMFPTPPATETIPR